MPNCAGGKDLNDDLRQLYRKHGQDHILLEISFPADYPTHPFMLRIVSPRCKCGARPRGPRHAGPDVPVTPAASARVLSAGSSGPMPIDDQMLHLTLSFVVDSTVPRLLGRWHSCTCRSPWFEVSSLGFRVRVRM